MPSATPCSRLPPVRLATNSSAGCAVSSSGRPIWCSRPSRITPIRSASVLASRKSWVTISVGICSPERMSASSSRTAVRVCASSADSGSSSSSTDGSRPSARATATRWRSPPLSRGGFSRARWPMPKRSSSSLTRRGDAPPNATLPATVMCGNSAYSWKTRPTERRSGARLTLRARSNQTSSPSAIRPSAGCFKPATWRRIVDLPAPLGPTSANVSAPTVRRARSSNVRRGSVRSSSSGATRGACTKAGRRR